MRIANIPPLLERRMRELDFVNLKQLAERALITPDILEDAVKGGRKITLTAALDIIKALNYEFDSEPLAILHELVEQYKPTENEIRVKKKLKAERSKTKRNKEI
jgi:hypothetical protein